MSPILFVNIAWMKFYDGARDDDVLEPGNFGYFRRSRGAPPKVGHEQWNFRRQDGRVLGYVPRSSGINIDRLGASPLDDVIRGVLVVFIARDPLLNRLKVVGWYENATVARDSRYLRTCDGTQIESPITAAAQDSFLLPVADRGEPVIPTAQTTAGGIGRSPLWYGDGHPRIVEQVRALVSGARRRRGSATSPRRGPRNPDPEARLAVEKISMDMALGYFDRSVDVSRKKLGWDIEAPSVLGTMLIEVKGLSGTRLVIELTPREYEQMAKHRERYILFVVTSALTKSASVRVFRFRRGEKGKQDSWSDGDTPLVVAERTGAVCRI